eukprot:g3973.t1
MGKALLKRHPELLVISVSGSAQNTGTSLFAFDAVVTKGSATASVQHITPSVAAQIILQSMKEVKAGESSGQVRISVTSAR